jgi:hypothetical protein
MGLGSVLRGILSRPAAPGAGGVAAGAPGPGFEAGRPSGAWRELPAIQRTVGPAPLVAPNRVFKAGLAAAKPAPTALAPLGHDRGLESPAGLVTGLAAPVQRAIDPVPSSVRRPGRPSRQAAGNVEALSVARLADTSTTESIVYPAFGAGRDAEGAGEPADAAAPGPSMGGSPVVARRTDAPPLTVAHLADAVPGGHVGHAASAQTALRPPSAASASSPASSIAASRPPAGATVAREVPTAGPPAIPAFGAPSQAVPTGVPPAVPAPGSDPAPLVARSPDTARPNLGQSRRLRIGAALSPGAATPLIAAASPAAAERGSVTTPDAHSGRSVQRHHAATGSSLAGLASSSPASPEDAFEAPEHLPVSREVTWAVPPSTPEDLVPDPAKPAYGGPTVVAREANIRPVPIRPLATDRAPSAPLVGTLQPVMKAASPAVAVRVQTEPEDEAEEPGSPAAALAALARMDRGADLEAPGSGWDPSEWPGDEAARPSLFSGPGAAAMPFAPAAQRASTSARAPVVARSLAGPTAAALPASSASVGLATPRATGGRLAVGRAAASPVTPALQRTMTWDPVNGLTFSASAATAVEPGSSPAQSTTSAAAGTPAATSASSASVPSITPLVARSFDGSVEEGLGNGVIQREEAAAPTSAATTAEGAAGTGAAAGATATMPEAQLDDLARRLHERIAARISRDLLVERERSGSLVDRGW